MNLGRCELVNKGVSSTSIRLEGKHASTVLIGMALEGTTSFYKRCVVLPNCIEP